MMIKVLQTNIDNKNRGGAYLLIRNLEPYMKQRNIRYDYLTMDEFIDDFDIKDIVTFSAKLRKNKLFGHLFLPFYVYCVVKDNKYEIIHINTDSAWKALLYAIPAKRAGVKKIIIHAHSYGTDGEFKTLKNIAHRISIRLLVSLAIEKVACSQEAAKWVFGKYYKNTNIIFNGINLDKYKYNKSLRERIRKNNAWEGKIIVGNVGLISETKNQIFLVRMMKYLKQLTSDIKLVFIGKHSEFWKEKLINEARKLSVLEYIEIWGEADNIPEILNGMDVIAIPSLFEGFSLSLLEAQASGIPCVASTSIPDIAIVSEWVKRMDLNQGEEEWANKVYELYNVYRIQDRALRVINDEYDISYMAMKLEKIYA